MYHPISPRCTLNKVIGNTEQAASQALSSAEFLRLILEDEVQFRKQVSAKKITTRA